MTHLKRARKLNHREQEVTLHWAANNGKADKQRTVRQETTKFKAGTLPLNMYATSAQSTEKILIEHMEEDHHEESERDEEQESEYGTESESELPPTADSDQEEEINFLRAVTTRSGRTFRIASKLLELTGTVALGAVKIVDA